MWLRNLQFTLIYFDSPLLDLFYSPPLCCFWLFLVPGAQKRGIFKTQQTKLSAHSLSVARKFNKVAVGQPSIGFGVRQHCGDGGGGGKIVRVYQV